MITSIAFYNGGAEKTRNYDFYLKNTTKSAFSGATDWIAVTEADKVFSGNVTMVAGDWTTIVLANPFVFDGSSNLVLVADDNTGSYTSSPHMTCRVFDASSQAIRVYSDGTNYNPLSPSSYSGTVLNVKNQIVLTKESLDGCIAAIPSDVEVGDITGNSASVTWTGYSDGYNVCIGIANIVTTVEDFTGSIPSGWNNSSSYPWTIVNGHMQSSNAGVASSTSSISATTTYSADGTIEFDAECMGEGTSSIWDKCIFSIDNVAQFTYGANVSGWNHYSYDVTAGQHTFTWTYSKDSSVDPTGDYFAVDNVTMLSGEITWNNPVAVEDASYTFTGLNPETDYCVKLQGVCATALSAWSEPVLFTTGEGSTIGETIELVNNWNWWSTNLDITLEQLEAALGSNGVKITAHNGDYAIYLSNGSWRGDIANFGVGNMYKIQTSAACSITVTGTPVNPADITVTLEPGANWIGVPFDHQVDIKDAFGPNFTPTNNDLVKDNAGNFATYRNGSWRGNVTLQPGQGFIYQSKASSNKTLTFSSTAKGDSQQK